MSWKPIEKFSDSVAAERAGLPIIVTTYDDAGTPSETPMHVGARYRFATEFINVLGTVVAINHGAQYPLTITYVNQYGDHLKEVFSPDEILLVLPL